MSNNYLNAEQALSAVCDALSALTRQRDETAEIFCGAGPKEWDGRKSARAVGELVGTADAHALACQMLSDYRKARA